MAPVLLDLGLLECLPDEMPSMSMQKLILSTNSWVGGRNLFLGIIYLVVAGLAFIAALAFLFCYHLGFIGRRGFGDLNRLSWNRKQ